ncbi:MAG: sigma 54-interacting transcriptional regulator [Bacillota bacterium]
MLVRDMIKGSKPLFLKPKDTLRDAVRLFHDGRVGAAPIVDEGGKVIGIFTRSSLYAALLADRRLDEPLDGLFMPAVVTVDPDSDLIDLEEMVKNSRVGQAVVAAEGRPVGLLTKADVVRALLDQCDSLRAELDSMKKVRHTLETVLEMAYDGLIVVDERGYVTMINQPLADLIGKQPSEVIGRHVTEVLENTRLDIVARTGVRELGHVQELRGQRFVVSRLPIIEDGRPVGAVGKAIFKNLDHLREAIRRMDTLEGQLAFYRDELERVNGTRYTLDSIITQNEGMVRLKDLAQQAARGTATILLRGESGTGKELFAHAIHNASPRRGRPFVKVNCAAVPEHLLESEFFGYAGGAFTDARKGGKPGKFELAAGGTIFLDEVGDMTPSLQAKLLRVLQEREFERVGGTTTVHADVRVIAATNHDLEAMVESGDFRRDLYYRLNVVGLTIPPLRERREDILPLTHQFITKFNEVMGQRVAGVTPEAAAILREHDWPGNVRELENVVERAMSLGTRDVIGTEHLPAHLTAGLDAGAASPRTRELLGYRDAVARAESRAIADALSQAGGNKARAARLLGISRSHLYEKIAEYGLGGADPRAPGAPGA